MIHIRPAGVADAPSIARIHVCSWRAAYRGIMPEPVLDGLSIEKRQLSWKETLTRAENEAADGRQTLVAEADGQVVGWAGFGPCRDRDVSAADTAEVYGIYLDPPAYRQGIGTLLWREVCTRLADRNHHRLAVWVLQENPSARRFYEAMGGVLESGVTRAFEREGVTLPEVRYWCPT
jgi:L-amino acid N-acyltransferase YncA